jgi:AcrR family transcriptional regulator
VPPAGPDQRRERRDAAENRKRVLAVAERLFEESGVEAVSMHQIAQAAGVGQGTLYRRYPHKGELCRDLLSETTQRFRQEIEDYLARNEGGTPALERLISVLARFVQLMETKTSLLAAIGDACWGQRRAEKFQSPGYQWIHGTVAALLTEAVAKGELRALDARFTADALLAALSPDVYQFQREERGLTPQEILQGVCRIFAEGSPGLVSDGSL